MWKRLGTLFLLLLFALSLEAQSLTYTWKDQALNELNNIEQQNQQLQQIINDYEKNYSNIMIIVERQEKSLIANDLALKNLEKSLKAYQKISIILCAVSIGTIMILITQ